MVLSIRKASLKMEKATCCFSVDLFSFVESSLIGHSSSGPGLVPPSYC